MIAEIMSEGALHSSATEGSDGFEESNVYIDLGDDDPENIDKALRNLVLEAIGNSFSEKGAGELEALLAEFKAVFD